MEAAKSGKELDIKASEAMTAHLKVQGDIVNKAADNSVKAKAATNKNAKDK